MPGEMIGYEVWLRESTRWAGCGAALEFLVGAPLVMLRGLTGGIRQVDGLTAMRAVGLPTGSSLCLRWG